MVDKFVDRRTIDLGEQVLEIEMTELFVNHLLFHFELENREQLTDEMISLYVMGSVKNATSDKKLSLIKGGKK